MNEMAKEIRRLLDKKVAVEFTSDNAYLSIQWHRIKLQILIPGLMETIYLDETGVETIEMTLLDFVDISNKGSES